MNWKSLAALALVGGLIGSAAVTPAQEFTNRGELARIARDAAVRAQREKAEATVVANFLGLPTRQVMPNGSIMELMRLNRGRPVYAITDNIVAADSVSADEVWAGGSAGLSLNGSGVTLGIWDGGRVRLTHQEFGGRVTAMDTAGNSDHATHVGGTMIAAGVSASAKGMSHAALLQSWDWNSVDSEMATAAAGGLLAGNHSWGYITGWYSSGGTWYWYGDVSLSQTEDVGFGYYDPTSQSWDDISYNAPYFLMVKSAGNDRGQGPTSQPTGVYWDSSTNSWQPNTVVRDRDGGTTGYDTVSWHGVAKNILTVAAVNDIVGGWTSPSSVVMSSFSGWGPTDDGRIKPDISANGIGLFSSVATGDANYASFSGTSMSSPNTTGSLGLLVQHYRDTHSGANMRAATLKGLVLHGADEAGANPGPDYAFGWGMLNVKNSAAAISEDVAKPNTITENTLNSGGTFTMNVTSDGSTPLKVTICWTDPASAPAPYVVDSPSLMLINDLDLRVSNGTTFFPWVLNPASPASAATTGDNFRDNVEQVYIAAPPAGTYSITVTHKGASLAPSGSQAFSMIVTGTGTPAGPPNVSGVSLNPTTVFGGNTSTGTVTLSAAAPAGGQVVDLSSSNTSVATVPSTVTVAQGATSANFTVTALNVSSNGSSVITASANSTSQQATLNVTARALSNLTLNPTTVTGGNTSTGTVTLNTAAPTGGAVVNLSSDNTAATVPATVTVSAGQTTANFTVNTTVQQVSQNATITATYNGSQRQAGLTVNSIAISSVSVNPTSVTGGASSTGTVTLDRAAPTGGSLVTLSSNNGAATVPASVTVSAGQTSATFTVNTTAVATQQIAAIGGSYNGSSQSANLTINPPSSQTLTLTISPNPVFGGSDTIGTVTLGTAAPAGGAVVSLVSSRTNVATVPASVTVPAGATSASFTVKTKKQRRDQTVNITASYSGLSSTVVLTVTSNTLREGGGPGGGGGTGRQQDGGNSLLDRILLLLRPFGW